LTPHPTFIPAGYRLQRPLGSGTTAHVFEARHPDFGRVALKLPKSEVQREPLLRRMFENEVQMTLPLKHPRVINAYAGYPTGAGAFLALEFCDGALAAHLCELLPLETAYRLVLDVAQGLRHSHERQILHRDVKPANVFTQGGRAKLGDFGTGAYLSDVFGAPQPSGKVGTAFYMAPEIFRGEPATVKSDLYSLGILAYEVIAGVRPFTGENEDELMLAHSSGAQVALRQHRPEVSLEVGRIVASAMSRTPDKRYGSTDAFISAFAAATGLPAGSGSSDLQIGRSGRVKRSDKTTRATKPNPLNWFRRKRS
jgi:serine/threonine protein kinase